MKEELEEFYVPDYLNLDDEEETFHVPDLIEEEFCELEMPNLICHIDDIDDFDSKYRHKKFVFETINKVNLYKNSRLYYQHNNRIIGSTRISEIISEDNKSTIVPVYGGIKPVEKPVEYRDFKGIRYFSLNDYLYEQRTKNYVYDFNKQSPLDIVYEPEEYTKYRILGYNESLFESLRLIESDSNITLPYEDIIEEFVEKVNAYCHKHDLKIGDEFDLTDVIEEYGDIDFKFTDTLDAKFKIVVPNAVFASYNATTVINIPGEKHAEYCYFFFAISYEKNKDEYFNEDCCGNIRHEFHHALIDIGLIDKGEDSLDYKINNNSIDMKKFRKEFNRTYFLLDRDFLEHYLVHFIYRLFLPTEDTALGPNIYGELKKMKSQKKNASEDLRKTTAYRNYKALDLRYKRYLNPLVHISPAELMNDESLIKENDMWDSEWDWAAFASELFNSDFIDNKFSTLNQFKKWFLNNAKKHLDKMKHTILRNANSYYQNQK